MTFDPKASAPDNIYTLMYLIRDHPMAAVGEFIAEMNTNHYIYVVAVDALVKTWHYNAVRMKREGKYGCLHDCEENIAALIRIGKLLMG